MAGKKNDSLTIAEVGRKVKNFFNQFGQNNSGGGSKLVFILPILTFLLPLVTIWALGEVRALGHSFQFGKALSPKQAETVAAGYISENFLQNQEAKVAEMENQGNVYAFTVEINGQTYPSYLTKDGRYLIPQGHDIAEYTQEVLGEDAPSKSKTNGPEVKKSDQPVVELFVMSHCPYGTQAEKGILPVVDLLEDKIDFSLRFVDYAMHDKKELDEQLKQYCLRENEPEKLNDYLSCFLQDEEKGEVCLNQTGVDQAQLNQCIQATDQEYQITANYNDKSTWKNGQFPPFNIDKELNEKYNVEGSPTLVINGEKASSSRTPAAYLETICAAFNNPPQECNQSLSDAAPQPGFGTGTTTTNTTEASCN